ncbi:MAG: hypothetical protein ACW9W3_05735 [Candidatus Nitrosopumilus sp. bin_68KS]
MKTRFLITGIGLLVFGLANLFSYLPISLGIALENRPFPFEHIQKVIPSEGHGTTVQTGYLPIENAVNDPYWLFWSLALYAGIVILCFYGINEVRK